MGHFPLWHVCVWMHVCGGQKTTWVNFSFCLEGSEDWTQIIRLSGKHLYLLTHLSDQSCVHVQKFTLIFLFFVYFRRFGNPFCVIKKLSWLCLNLPSLSWVLNLYASNFFTWKKILYIGSSLESQDLAGWERRIILESAWARVRSCLKQTITKGLET